MSNKIAKTFDHVMSSNKINGIYYIIDTVKLVPIPIRYMKMQYQPLQKKS